MQQVFNLTPVTDLVSAQFVGGAYIKSVTIDNPSGSWLQISADKTFVPPYTIGFAHNLDYNAVSTDVRFVTGPAGQVSTTFATGNEKVVVTIDTEPVISSGGSDYLQFVSKLEQPDSLFFSVSSVPTDVDNLSNLSLLGGSTTKRIRLFSIFFSVTVSAVMSRPKHFVTLLVSNPVGTVFYAFMYISPNLPVAQLIFNPPLDCLKGQDLSLQENILSAVVGDIENVDININYAII